MRLDKLLADMGIGTRSELKKMIRDQRIAVDGSIVRDAGFQVRDPQKAEICLDGFPIRYEPYVYYMLNKPAGVLSAAEDARRTTVVDLIRDGEALAGRQVRTDLFPVGRLDLDTEGLLLITNDGPLAHRLLAPAQHVDKTYEAVVSGRITEEDAARFRQGIQYDRTLRAEPAGLRVLSVNGEGTESRIEVTIHEGKFHQIRKMVAALGEGKEVKYLKRTAMGALSLDPALAPGEYRRLTTEETAALPCSKPV